MRFIFRADASREIGSGHVMRSSVLAEEAISRGYECFFVGRISDLDWVAQRISKLGFSQVLSVESAFTPNIETDVLILDSYSIPVANAFIAKENWKLVLSICDEISPRYVTDIELRPGLQEIGGAHDGPVVLEGAEFILIRKGIEKSSRKVDHVGVPKVLVVGGGSDPFGYVKAVTEVISSLGLKLEVHVFTQDAIPNGSEVSFVTHPIGSKMDLMASDVDVVLTTASTSSLEFIAREIPTGVVSAVDNQDNYYEELGRLGYAQQIGKKNSDGEWWFDRAEMVELLGNQRKRETLRDLITGLIDLKGAERVIDFLVSFKANQSKES
jgi:spore coat polysaccharide biosynthesis predicted glycosyltransferase SpsG